VLFFFLALDDFDAVLNPALELTLALPLLLIPSLTSMDGVGTLVNPWRNSFHVWFKDCYTQMLYFTSPPAK